jgi:hypothetical protein
MPANNTDIGKYLWDAADKLRVLLSWNVDSLI